MSLYDLAFNRIVMVEGGYSNHPSDAGGATMYGITEEVARRHGYAGVMQDVPLQFAKDVYKTAYWDKLLLDDIVLLSPAVAEELFDSGVNCGPETAGRWLQIALNAFNLQGKLYADVVEDGVVGPMTLHSLKFYFAKRGRDAAPVLLRALNTLQGAHYIAISRSRPKNEDFTFGWFLNRVS